MERFVALSLELLHLQILSVCTGASSKRPMRVAASIMSMSFLQDRKIDYH